MNRRAKSCIAAATLVLVSFAAQADGDTARGAKLAYSCLGCHGIENYKNAYPKYSVPKLGGQNRAYIVAALAEYKAGARWHPTMRGFATDLSSQDRADRFRARNLRRGRVEVGRDLHRLPRQERRRHDG